MSDLLKETQAELDKTYGSGVVSIYSRQLTALATVVERRLSELEMRVEQLLSKVYDTGEQP